MLRVGLTGGIGAGKSATADLFAALGVPIIDADQIARHVVRPGSPCLKAIVDDFGNDVLTPSGHLDRTVLRQRIFTDAERRKRLEAILHPAIRAEMEQRIRTLSQPYCLLVIPLLLETGQTDLTDRILVVDAPDELRVQRVCQRDSVDPHQVKAIMDAQWERNVRLSAADDVITNDGDLAHLRQQVVALHERYTALAAATTPGAEKPT